jgi:ABC-type multidrug transport system ATPase subunit
MSGPVLAADRLCVALGGAAVLHDVSVAFEPGVWFGLLGINGSGKTTLLRTLAGRQAPVSGAVQVRGAVATPVMLAAAVGFAPPPDSLPAELLGGELIDLVARARRADLVEVRAVAEALGVPGLAGTLIGAMSAGMRQRIALLLAFLGRPDVVLLDEPFNWLDPVATYDFKEQLAALTAQGLCVVTSLHDVATLATRCDRGCLLHDGRVVQAFSGQDLQAARGDVSGLERRIHRQFREYGRHVQN